MRARSRLLVAAAVTAAAVLLVVAGAGAQSLEEVRESREQVQRRLDRAAEDLAGLEARIGRIDARRRSLDREVRQLTTRARRAERRIDARVRDLYKRGGLSSLTAVLGGDSPQEAVDRAAMLGHVVADDRVTAEASAAARRRAGAARERLTAAERRLADARAELERRLESLRSDLEEARRLEARLEEERRRERRAERRQQAAASTPRASSAPAPGGLACPVAPPRSYSDTWGAPRSGGRSHEGTDILAPYGTAVYAATAGTWDIMPRGGSAGNWAILQGADGNDYWYLHLQSHVAADGERVAAGEQVATNGDTGNAAGTPHVHLELHPGGGTPVNPYPTVQRACG